MASPSLRDMYRLSGSSQPTSTTQGSPQQPATTASQARPSRPTAAARQESGDSVDTEEAGWWYLTGSQYPTPYSQSENTQPFFTGTQSASTSRPSAATRQHSGETRRPTRSRAEDTRQQLGAASQPATSRSSDERPRYPSAPQPPAVSRPYDERPRYTSAPEVAALTQTSGHGRRPSTDRTRYSATAPDTPQSVTGSFRRADRPSSGTQPSTQAPPVSYTSRPADDRSRYSMRTTDDRQRYSTVSQATTIAQPSSARVSEERPRYGGGAPATTTVSSHDFAGSSGPASSTTTSAHPASTATTAPVAPPRTVIMNVPHRISTGGLEGPDIKPADADDSGSTSDILNAPVSIEVFRALLGIPQGGTPLALSNLRQAADRIDEGRTPLTASTMKPLTRSSTAKSSSIAPAFKIRSRGPSWMPRWLRRKPSDSEYDTSVYYNLIREQKRTQRLWVLYDVLVYVCLILQLIIAAVLIILGALNGNYHISIAILGAVTGIITGILSLIRGQGLPNRLMQYLDGLRRIRDDIEFTERKLRAGITVTYQQCIDLWNAYENVREDATKNHPDTWTNWNASTSASGTGGNAVPAKAGTRTATPKKDVEVGKPF